MVKKQQALESKRRIPRQARSAETVALILEATAQILEAGGLPAFTTNAVAERAGVSIGTLYQYFADKNEILLALARQQMTVGLADIGRAQLATGVGTVTMHGEIRPCFRRGEAHAGPRLSRTGAWTPKDPRGLGSLDTQPPICTLGAAHRLPAPGT